jgi:hypothetical protein
VTPDKSFTRHVDIRINAEADRRIAESPERQSDYFTFIAGGDTFRSNESYELGVYE